MRSRPIFVSIVFFCALFSRVLVGCGVSDDDLLQGNAYSPDGALSVAPATERSDAATCDGAGPCFTDASTDVVIVPLPDGSTEPSNTCGTARAIGNVSGDTGASSTTANGTCSEWLSVHVTEDDSSALGAGMHVTLTLTPKNSDFELYAYFDPNQDGLECTIPPAKSSFNPGTAVETIDLAWGEGSVANNSDDTRTIAIAVVKAPGGPCSSTTTWDLVVAH